MLYGGARLATMDDFASQDNVMVAQAPVEGLHTAYACLGDLLA
jgi:hypothetical protein